MSTVPSTGDEAESMTRIKAPSPLVLAAMESGFSAAEAIEIATARAAESARVASWGAL